MVATRTVRLQRSIGGLESRSGGLQHGVFAFLYSEEFGNETSFVIRHPFSKGDDKMSCSFRNLLSSSMMHFGAVACVLISGVVLDARSQGGVIYTEEFATPDGSGGGLSLYGWNAGYGAEPVESGVSGGYGYCRTYVNSAPTYPAANIMVWTTEPGDVASALFESMSFDANTNTSTVLRVAVRIDGDWFVTDGVFPPSSASGWNRYTFDWTTDAAVWRDVTYDQGSELSLGAVRTSDLPSGSVSAFGFFTDGVGGSQYVGTSRFDNIEISIVPEPSSMVVLATLVLMALATLRRRRNTR